MATSKVDITTELLLFGYIRDINLINQIIPKSIILLCIKFYHFNLRIFSLKAQSFHTSYFPQICINEIDKNINFKLNINSLNNSFKKKKI